MPQPEINKSIISAEFPFRKKFVEVTGQNMAYVDVGEGCTSSKRIGPTKSVKLCPNGLPRWWARYGTEILPPHPDLYGT